MTDRVWRKWVFSNLYLFFPVQQQGEFWTIFIASIFNYSVLTFTLIIYVHMCFFKLLIFKKILNVHVITMLTPLLPLNKPLNQTMKPGSNLTHSSSVLQYRLYNVNIYQTIIFFLLLLLIIILNIIILVAVVVVFSHLCI